MRAKKLFSIILCLCMLVGLCQFSFTASAESVVTMSQTKFVSGVQEIPCAIITDSTDWWAAIYPASQTTYGGGTPVYADYLDKTTGARTFPSGQAI